MTIDSGLATAQRAIELPEVQELVKRLAAYGLGVFMPHMHDEAGNMLPLPAGMVQVEDELTVSFKPVDQVVETPNVRYLPVGWTWSELTQQASPQIICRIEKRNGEHVHVKVSMGH